MQKNHSVKGKHLDVKKAHGKDGRGGGGRGGGGGRQGGGWGGGRNQGGGFGNNWGECLLILTEELLLKMILKIDLFNFRKWRLGQPGWLGW